MNSILGFIFFIGIFCGILLGIHWVVYRAIVSICKVKSSSHLLWLRASFIVLGLSFVSASILSSRYDVVMTRSLYTFSAVWMGFLTYLFLCSCMYFILFPFLKRHPRKLVLIGKGLIALAIVVSVYGLYNANRIVIKPVSIQMENLPESWKGRTAVFISDVHLGHVRGKNFSERVVREIEKINPDIIFNTGDLYDGVKVDAHDIISPFRRLTPPLGSYFVLGNHEEYRDSTGFSRAITAANMSILTGEAIIVDGVQIVGVDYMTTTSQEAFAQVMGAIEIDSEIPSILLKHSPQHLEIAEKAGIDLQLSGHTHRAQVFPLNIITHILYKGYDYGLKPFNDMQVLVTSGVGTWGPPMRVGSNSEIMVITFE